MKYWKSLVAACGPTLFIGCGGYPSQGTPQEQAAYMLDQQIQDVKNSVSNHESRLPSDRNRWQESDITILNNLYARLDDLYRQRQVLAAEVGNQRYDARTSVQPVPTSASKK